MESTRALDSVIPEASSRQLVVGRPLVVHKVRKVGDRCYEVNAIMLIL